MVMATLIVYMIFGLIPFYQAFLVKRNPMKIRNLRKMKALQPEAELDPGMQKVYFVNYLITGILWMLTSLIGWYYGIKPTYVMFVLAIIGGIVVFVAKWRITGIAQTWHMVMLALAVVLAVVYHIWLVKDSKVKVLLETFAVEGDYGIEMPYQAIDSVFIVEALPAVKYCKDGYSVFGNKKGEFRLKEGSDAKFYLLGKQPPYLKMYTNDGLVFVNRKTATETEQLIEELKSKVGEKFIE